ncbi:hypothetical protein [Yinghuangia sp. YIM S10712]|uniref:hypothetical protein n=1 Tax=Yinghuangia sp. YIM S10712 TaxID=3436930 RepID=UPI003F53423D
MLRTTSIAATAAVAAVFAASPTASAADETTQYRAVVVAGGKPVGVVEGQQWGTYGMLRDASGDRIGDASITCVAEKARDKRVLAKCTHVLRVHGQGRLVVQGMHHYKDQTVMPGTADPMRLNIVRGSGYYAGASGPVDVIEVIGGYTYTFGPTG